MLTQRPSEGFVEHFVGTRPGNEETQCWIKMEDACVRRRSVSLTVVVDFLVFDELVILTLPSVLAFLCAPIKANSFQSFQLVL